MARVKTPSKMFITNQDKLKRLILSTVAEISDLVGSSLGPSGKVVLLESEVSGIPNKITKDGVSIFRAIGYSDPFKHAIAEQMREAAVKTVNEAGDGPVDLYTKILTPTGFVTMGEVKVGMDICGTNGTVQQVLGVYPKGLKENYRVHFSGGGVVRCCKDHLWTVTTDQGEKKTLPLRILMEDYVSKTENNTDKHKYFVQTTVVEFKEDKDKMPIDPYLLGVLLGDGSLSGTGTIEISLGKAKEHIIEKLILPEGVDMRSTWVEDKNCFRIKLTGKSKGVRSILKELLDSIGLLGVNSHTKFIPKAYLFSSVESRTKLLQGLIDTDGYLNKHSELFEFSSVSKQLADDLADLCRSLGKQISIREKDRSNGNGYSKNNTFVVKERRGFDHGNKILKIEPIGETVEMQCIKVSNPDNLYITDNFVVTHNTTTSTILSAAFVQNLFTYCDSNRKSSPQKVVRYLNKIAEEEMYPAIKKASIKINKKNLDLLERVATISSNGDKEMAKKVMEAFSITGFSTSSHVTIQELSGPSKYEVDVVEGFSIHKGYEESIGRFHTAFINDQANQRISLEAPLFLLFDGAISDPASVTNIMMEIGELYASGQSEFKNVVVVAHGFSDNVLTWLALNAPNPSTINIVPLKTPITQLINSQLAFLQDLSAVTGASIFGMANPLFEAKIENLGYGVEKIEINRFKATVIGEPNPELIQERAEQLRTQIKNSESIFEKMVLEERLGSLTNGIAQFKIYGSSNGEIKEKVDRAEDAICAVRAALNHGVLPGGCRVLVNIALGLQSKFPNDDIVNTVIVPSLFSPFLKLVSNAGFNNQEIQDILQRYVDDDKVVYDVENQIFGDPKVMGIFDATLAVNQALTSAISIAGVLGCLSSIVVTPRDAAMELQDFRDSQEFQRTIDNAEALADTINERF